VARDPPVVPTVRPQDDHYGHWSGNRRDDLSLSALPALVVAVVTRPAENQQTVEAALDLIVSGEAVTTTREAIERVRTHNAARVALRDLVAQADDARAALEQIDRLGDHRAEYPGLVKQIVRHALVRLDGAR